MKRRTFLQTGPLLWGSLWSKRMSWAQESSAPETTNHEATDAVLKIGLVTDLHYADKPAAGSRHYRETLDKFADAAAEFQRQEIDLLVELGDLVDAADDAETEKQYVRRINRELSAVTKQRHYVLGNHCVHTLTKNEFLGEVEQTKSFYSFDASGIHLVILDACFRSDGQPYGRQNFQWTDANISNEQLEWLKSDLQANSNPTIVFVHQRLDVQNAYGIKNAAAVRQILENAGTVSAVFQGHSHKNDHQQINAIDYVTLVAMVEGSGKANNGYSLLTIHENKSMSLTGFQQQASRSWQ
ncbi:MAG: metallophosphoesterase [Pirellulaceae bacterium]